MGTSKLIYSSPPLLLALPKSDEQPCQSKEVKLTSYIENRYSLFNQLVITKIHDPYHRYCMCLMLVLKKVLGAIVSIICFEHQNSTYR